MNKLNQAINVVNAVTNTMDETPEQTETRRALEKESREQFWADQAEHEENEISDRQQAHIDAGMCESDFF